MRAVIYARYSSDSQTESSVEGQIRECREYAERHNIKVVTAYIDRALSAKTDDRPEFPYGIIRLTQRILDKIKGLRGWSYSFPEHKPTEIGAKSPS